MRLVYVVGRFVVYLPFDQILLHVEEIFAHGLQQLQSIAAVEVSKLCAVKSKNIISSSVMLTNIYNFMCIVIFLA